MSTTTIERLLSLTKQAIEVNSHDTSNTTGTSFETLVFETMSELSMQFNESINVTQTGPQSFPDIIIDFEDHKFGIEVKYSKSGNWTSLGNSVFESTSISGVNEIYLFFGKKSDVARIDVRYCEYSLALSDIKVTHSPRFYIDMERSEPYQEAVEFILEQAGSYSAFRETNSEQKIELIQTYFHEKNITDSKWFVSSRKEEIILQSSLKSYNELSDLEKKKLLIEALVLFPELFSVRTTKYQQLSVFWITNYQVYSSNIRDMFSAGGQLSVNHLGENIKLPRAIKTLLDNFSDITDFINDVNNAEILTEFMNKNISNPHTEPTSYIDYWKTSIMNYVHPSYRSYLQTRL